MRRVALLLVLCLPGLGRATPHPPAPPTVSETTAGRKALAPYFADERFGLLRRYLNPRSHWMPLPPPVQRRGA